MTQMDMLHVYNSHCNRSKALEWSTDTIEIGQPSAIIIVPAQSKLGGRRDNTEGTRWLEHWDKSRS
jgi:hypothetical protein